MTDSPKKADDQKKVEAEMKAKAEAEAKKQAEAEAKKQAEEADEAAKKATKEAEEKAKLAQGASYKCLERCFSGGRMWKVGEVRVSVDDLPEALWEKI